MVKVSVIIPVYGVEKYIARCLDTVINQTLKEIEIIIVNDDTKDSSMIICEEYAKKDQRIKLYNKKNEGLGFTRNYGIARATGEYIAFLDSDDFIDLDFYEKLYNTAKKYSSDFCFGEVKKYYNSSKSEVNLELIPKDIDSELEPKEILYSMLEKENKYNLHMGMSVWKSLYKRSIIEKYNTKFLSEREILSEDIFFNFDFLQSTNTKVSFCRDTYYYYCFNDMSLTNSYRKDRFEKAKVLRKELINKALKYGEYEKLKKDIDIFFLNYVRVAIKQAVYFSEKRNIRKKRIQEILNDVELQEILKNSLGRTKLQKIFDLCMKYKITSLLILFAKIRNASNK